MKRCLLILLKMGDIDAFFGESESFGMDIAVLAVYANIECIKNVLVFRNKNSMYMLEGGVEWQE